MSSNFRWIPGVLLLILLVVGCETVSPAEPVVSPVPAPTADQVTLYFPHRTRPVLVREVRQVERRGEQPEWLAMQQLMAGPQSPDARPLFAGSPESQVAIAAKVVEGSVALLLTQPAADTLAKGGDLLPVHALVATLGSFPRVESVRFLVEGRQEPLRVAGADLSKPMKPRWDLVEEGQVEVRVRESSAALPANCTPQDVRDLLTAFLHAYNTGDQERLKNFFGEGFQWFSVPTEANQYVAVHTVSDLYPYFAARHKVGEQMKLQKLEVSAGSWHGGIDIVFIIQRTAEDLTPTTINAGGKGMVTCENKTISVWSMGAVPVLR